MKVQRDISPIDSAATAGVLAAEVLAEIDPGFGNEQAESGVALIRVANGPGAQRRRRVIHPQRLRELGAL